jgi:hypothetical protein
VALRHRGSQPQERLRPACTSGCAPRCTCASPPGSPQVSGGGGVHGAGLTPTYGGLATQVSAPPTREVRRDSQPHRVTAGLLHLHPRGRGNETVMANYFPVDLTRTARSWLMNLPEGTLHSWSELCHQFMANFESAYARPGNETDLHAIQQRLEKPCAPSSSGSLRFAIPLLVSPMLL